MRTAVKVGIAASVLAALCTAPLALYVGAWSMLSGLLLGVSIMAAPLLLPLAGIGAAVVLGHRGRSGAAIAAAWAPALLLVAAALWLLLLGLRA